MSIGKVFLIPAPLFDFESEQIAVYVKEKAITIQHYFVENIRTARRVLKSYDKSVDIDAIQFFINNNKEATPVDEFKKILQSGQDVGIMSEAGMPAMADPGSELVAIAHNINATIIPLVGPSSLLLALCASGLNGQQFRFIGYLPIDNGAKIKLIKQLEQKVIHDSETQIFIETPYRNKAVLQQLLKTLPNDLKLCIAVDITSPAQQIITKTIQEWAKETIDLHKRPTIFLIGK